MILVKAEIEKISDNHFIGRIEKMKGMIVEAESREAVKKELLISLKVKIAFDYGLEISELDCGELTNEQAMQQQANEHSIYTGETENLSLTLV